MSLSMQEKFDPARFGNVLRFELMSNGMRFVYFLAAVLGLFSVSCLLSLLRRSGIDSWPGFLSLLAFFFGLFGTSDLFRDEHHPARAPFALLLPASMAERFLAKVSISLVLYPLAFVTGVVLIGNLFEVLSVLLGVESFNPVWPDRGLAHGFLTYCMGHAVFFAGAVFFNRNVLGKTILSGALYLALCALLFAIVGTAWAVDAGLFQILMGAASHGGLPLDLHWDKSPNAIGAVFLFIARVVALATLYAAAWFRFQEIEVR